MTEPREYDQTDAERIEMLERTLREIVALADKYPKDDRLHVVKVLAKAGLGAASPSPAGAIQPNSNSR